MNNQLQSFIEQINLPKQKSHKGQNGKVMVIGGSKLFHAASKWSLDTVSRIVDMVFYASVPQNNALIKRAKRKFWNGIVVPRNEIETYIEEAQVILIGPGMERKQTSQKPPTTNKKFQHPRPSKDEWLHDTEKIVNYLLQTYPHKKWVLDAGALQMVDPNLLNSNTIITPHTKELSRLIKNANLETKMAEIETPAFSKFNQSKKLNQSEKLSQLKKLSKSDASDLRSSIIPPTHKSLLQSLNNPTVLLKGSTDTIFNSQSLISITGGNQGMTKGGTGDVLSGLVTGLYCWTNNPLAAAVLASFINKSAGNELFQNVGPFFNATDLENQVPKTMAEVFGYTKTK